MKSLTVGMAALASLSVWAADYTWQGASANWTATGNWKNGSGTDVSWADGQNTIFPVGSSLLNVNVNATVAPGQLLVNDDYRFSGSGTIDVNGNFYVESGKTSVFDAKLTQTTADSGKRLVSGKAGTRVLQGGAELWRYQHDNGTTRVNGGTFKLTGESTGAGGSTAAAAFMRGDFIVEGGATVSFAQKATYMPNSGVAINVTNGTFDASKVTEVLNGFADNRGSYNTTKAYIRVADKGTFIAPKIRIGKVEKDLFDASPEYGRIYIDKGGLLKVREWSMDSSDTYYGQIHFNGGTWDIITNGSDKTSVQMTPFGTGTGKQWNGVTLTVDKGGAYIKNESSMNRKLTKAFTSGDANDGGVHILGSGGLLYMNATNTFNGGTYLDGALTYIPYNDRAFGAIPPAPTDNIFFTSSSMTLHSDFDTDLHPNRNVLISSNVTAQIGNGQRLRIKGTISTAGKDPSASVLKIVDNWAGSLALAPTDGRTNVLGRVYVAGRLTIEDGTTLITKDTGATASSSSALGLQGFATRFADAHGVLEVTGGMLKVTKNVYVYMKNFAQLKVSGGTFDATATREILNGMDTPCLTEVGGTGVIETVQLRLSQVDATSSLAYTNGIPTACVHVSTGGVLRLTKFYIDNKGARVGRLDLDGGTVASRSDRTSNKDFLGVETMSNWQNILVRSCAGGAIFDTTKGSVTVHTPIASGAAHDGGLVKKGPNVLSLYSTNTYNGVTRADDGTLKFCHQSGFPGGDLGVSVAKCNRANARLYPMIWGNNLAFKPGAKVRVYDTADLVGDFGKKIILAQSGTVMTNPPTEVVIVDKDGNEKPGAGWGVTRSSDGKYLYFGRVYGTTLIVR